MNNSRILFKFWKDAYEWDQGSHSLPLHERLTDGHFDLNPRSRMRNSLAEEVLDKRMLFLMEVFDILLLKTILQVIMPVMLRCQKRYATAYVVVYLCPCLKLYFHFWGCMVMYNKGVQTKYIKLKPRITLNEKNTH